MDNRHISGIQPEILAKFKEVFPEHADIEEYLYTRGIRNDSGHRTDSASHANTNNNASLEQAQVDMALILSLLPAQTLPVSSNNAPAATPRTSRSRNLSPQGSRNNSMGSETAEAIALSLQASTVPVPVPVLVPVPVPVPVPNAVPDPVPASQGAASEGSSLPGGIIENVDPDNWTYEALQSLGDAIGSESRGLSKELLATFPTQILNDKSGWFSSKKSKPEECTICLMEYEIEDELLTLPCLHLYHKLCITRWLTDNKTCPVCNMDLSESSHS